MTARWSVRLWAWGQSDPGRKRERNEDSYLVDPETGVDGGGRRHGRTSGRRDGEPDGGRVPRRASSPRRAATSTRRCASRSRAQQCARPRRCRSSMPDHGRADVAPPGLRASRRAAAPRANPPVRGGDPTLPPGALRVLARARADARRGAGARARRSSRHRGPSPSCAAWARR